jgi:hypothetical protein
MYLGLESDRGKTECGRLMERELSCIKQIELCRNDKRTVMHIQ